MNSGSNVCHIERVRMGASRRRGYREVVWHVNAQKWLAPFSGMAPSACETHSNDGRDRPNETALRITSGRVLPRHCTLCRDYSEIISRILYDPHPFSNAIGIDCNGYGHNRLIDFFHIGGFGK